MSEDYYKKKAKEEAGWKNKETEWLENLKKTPLYAELQAEYDETSLETGLGYMAQSRTRIYRYGPDALVEMNKKSLKFQTDATYFLKQIQEKKWYDACLGWMIGDVHLQGIYSMFQLSFERGSAFYRPFIEPVKPEEIDFLRHLLQDEAYICSNEFPRFYSNNPEAEDLSNWQKERNSADTYPEDYPVFFRRYDEWFNQAHRLLLPLQRYKKYLNYREVVMEKRNAERPPAPPDPEEGKKYYLDYAEMREVCAEWFRRYENTKMQTWYAAHQKYIARQSVYDSTQFYEAMDALMNSYVKPYPDGGRVWDKALITEGRRIWFRDISANLEPAYKAYLHAMKTGKPVLDEADVFRSPASELSVNENEKVLIFEGQKILGEPENLNY